MPNIKRLSANEIIKFLERQGFVLMRQKGSHMVLIRQLSMTRQVLTVPNHKNMDIGMLKGLYNQAKQFIPEEDLQKLFYSI